MGAFKRSSKGKNRVQAESLEPRRLLSAGQIYFVDNGIDFGVTDVARMATDGSGGTILFGDSARQIVTDGTSLYTLEAPAGGTNAVYKYNPADQSLNQHFITNVSPLGLAIAGSNLFVANAPPEGTGYISKYTLDGQLVAQNFIGSTAVIFADGGNLLVMTGDNLPTSGTSISEYNGSTGALMNASFITPTASSGGAYFSLATYNGDIFANSVNGTVDEFDAATGALVKEQILTLPNWNASRDRSYIALDNSELFISHVNFQQNSLLREYSLTGTLYATVNMFDPISGGPEQMVVLGTSGTPLTNSLSFTSEPVTKQQDELLNPISVQVESPAGGPVADTQPVTLSLGGGVAGEGLLGTTTVTPVNGIATFTGLSISDPADGYVLIASSGAYQSAVSSSFSIVAKSVLSPVFGKTRVPLSVVTGEPWGAKLPIALTNTGSRLHGKVTVNLFANTSPTLDGNQILLKSVKIKNLVIKANHKAGIGLSVPSLPGSFAPGIYYLIAQVVDPLQHTASVATDQTISVAAPLVAGTVSFTAVQGPFAKGTLNSVITFTITVTNTGNVPLRGQKLTVTSSYISASHLLPVTGFGFTRAFGRPLAMNATRKFKVRYRATKTTPPAGLYALQAQVPVAGSSAVIIGGTDLDLAGQAG